MNRTGKIALIAIGGLLTICLCLVAAAYLALQGTGRFLAGMVDNDPATVTRTRDEIAAYTVPAGFDGGAAVTIAGFSIISHTGDDGRSHIFFIQEPSWLEMDEVELEQHASQASGAEVWAETRLVDRQPCRIRGQETTLVINEGVSHDNRRYRSASVLFEGNGGTALLTISAPADSWDEEMVQSFIESIE